MLVTKHFQVVSFSPFTCSHKLTETPWSLMFLQINSEGVTRNFYSVDKLPTWHEELEPHNSLLDILNATSPEPMNI